MDGKSSSVSLVNELVLRHYRVCLRVILPACVSARVRLVQAFTAESPFVLSGRADVWRASNMGFMTMRNTLAHV